VSSRLLSQVGHLARRSVVRTIRQPAMVVPALAFPLLLFAINSVGLDAASNLPGFPTDSYLTFWLGFTFMQGTIFATMLAGTNIAEDIGSGFFNRLALTPLRGVALLAGQLAGVIVLGIVQALAFLAVGLAAGADFEAGPAGVLVIFALSILVSAGFGAIGLMAGLRTGSGEAVQGLFPVMFVFLFFASTALPRDLIEQDWFQTVATINPVSYVIEGFRSLLIEGWNGEALALGFAVGAGLLTIGLAGAAASLKGRMART
jgi:ABC-2 type transport system permease protein